LGYTRNSVIFDTVQLPDTMPMYSGTVVNEVICDVDNKVISPVCDDGWARNCSVEGKYIALVTING